jgi:hypothetical protein
MGVFITDDEYTEELEDFTYQLVDLVIRHRIVAKRKANAIEQSLGDCTSESTQPKQRKVAVVAPNNSRLSTPSSDITNLFTRHVMPSPSSNIRARSQHEIGQSLRRFMERVDHDQFKCICGRQKRKQFKQCGVCYRNGNCQVTRGKCKSCYGPCGPLFVYCNDCSSDMQ